MSESFLCRVRFLKLYDFFVVEFDMTMQKLIEFIEHVKSKNVFINKIDDLIICFTKIIYRCKISFEKSMHEDRNELFLMKIYNTIQQQKHMTSFNIKKNMFYKFFDIFMSDSLTLNSKLKKDIKIQVEKNETIFKIFENTLIDETFSIQIVSETIVKEKLNFLVNSIFELKMLRLFRRYS